MYEGWVEVCVKRVERAGRALEEVVAGGSSSLSDASLSVSASSSSQSLLLQ